MTGNGVPSLVRASNPSRSSQVVTRYGRSGSGASSRSDQLQVPARSGAATVSGGKASTTPPWSRNSDSRSPAVGAGGAPCQITRDTSDRSAWANPAASRPVAERSASAGDGAAANCKSRPTPASSLTTRARRRWGGLTTKYARLSRRLVSAGNSRNPHRCGESSSRSSR